MSLSRKDVANIAELARLEIDEQGLADTAADLSPIVDFVAQLASVPVEGIEPMAHPLDATQRLRADTVTECDERERFQREAPATEDGLYLVPRVIE